MARPREFDVETVLREAMEVFWEKGFDGTSFADIEARTGVKKASLFAAYGDKRSLYLKALQSYQEASREEGRGLLGKGSPKAAIRRWFLAAAGKMAKGDGARRGCLQVNCVTELAGKDEEIAGIARESTELLVGVIAETIERGQGAGEFRKDVPARTLARYLVTTIHGLSVDGKVGIAGREVDRIAEVALSTLEP